LLFRISFGFRVLDFGFGVLVALCLAATALPGCSSKPKARQVVLYCSADDVIAQPILDEFRKTTGIEVSVRFDDEGSKTSSLAARLRAESGSPSADVFWSSEVFYTILLAREGLLAPWDGLAGGVPARYRGAEGRWYGFGLRARAIVYSTTRVKPDDTPRRLEDLIDPRWKGRIAMAQPQFGTTGGDVASWFAHYGPQKAREILEKLKANDVLLVAANSTAVRMVTNGQADAAMTDTDDVYAAQAKGEAVAMVPLDQGGEGVLAIPNTVALVKGGPHPEEARLLAAFLMSRRAEEMLAQSESHNTPVRKALAERFPQYAIPRPLDVDYERIADQLPAALKAAGEVFRK
jgi:iron(III) transport system substrate-binding protein